MPPSVLIIGAGIGGLATGCYAQMNDFTGLHHWHLYHGLDGAVVEEIALPAIRASVRYRGFGSVGMNSHRPTRRPEVGGAPPSLVGAGVGP